MNIMLTMSSTPFDVKSQLYARHSKIKLVEWKSRWMTCFNRFIPYTEQWVLQPSNVAIDVFLSLPFPSAFTETLRPMFILIMGEDTFFSFQFSFIFYNYILIFSRQAIDVKQSDAWEATHKFLLKFNSNFSSLDLNYVSLSYFLFYFLYLFKLFSKKILLILK